MSDQKLFRRWAPLLMLALGYLAAACVFHPFARDTYPPAPLWGAAGIALASLLLGGARLWPGVAVGAVLAAFASGGSWSTALVDGTGATLEALIAASLTRTHVGVPRRFRRVAHVLAFASCCAVGALANAFVQAAVPAFQGAGIDDALWIWWAQWQSHFLGMLAFAPLVLAMSSWPVVTWSPTRRIEIGLYTVLLALLSVEMAGVPDVFHFPSRFPFMVLPLIMWSAFRFGQRVVTTTAAFACSIAAWSMAAGRGPFSFSDPYESQVTMLLFSTIVTVTGLMVSAVVRDRRDTLKELWQKREELEARVRERTL